MGVFFVLQQFVVVLANGDFLHVVVVGIVADHFDNVVDSGFVLADQLRVFVLLAQEDADFALLSGKLSIEVSNACSLDDFVSKIVKSGLSAAFEAHQ